MWLMRKLCVPFLFAGAHGAPKKKPGVEEAPSDLSSYGWYDPSEIRQAHPIVV